MNNTNNNALELGTILQGKAYTYTIQKILGQGTFGITYLATTKVKVAGALGELETTMQVAIKEFFMKEINGREDNTVTSGSKGGIYDKYKKKFAREAENLSKLHHPNIVKVLEYFETNNTVYYAMEYVEGGNLDAYIAQHNGLPEAECVKYAQQIGSALSYMHAHKMLHLDLKPGNVMLRPNKDAVLIDFGLSKQYDDNGNPETSTTIGGGTPGYAPIEQSDYHEGKGFPVTMDVYALGATMFKMLTGVRPPEASVILNDGFPAYELQKHQVSDVLIACVAKAMSALKKDRPQSVEALLTSLGSEETSLNLNGNEDTIKADKDIVRPAKADTNPTPTQNSSKNKIYIASGVAAVLIIAGIIASNLENKSDTEGDATLTGWALSGDSLASTNENNATLSDILVDSIRENTHQEETIALPEKPHKEPETTVQQSIATESNVGSQRQRETTEEVITLKPNESFDYIGKYEDGLAVVRHKNKYGFINTSKEIVIPIKYDAVGGNWDYNNERTTWRSYYLMPVCQNGKWGMINRTGKVIIPIIYDDIDYTVYRDDELYWVKKGNLYGCVNSSGEIVIPITYQNKIEFYNGQPARAKKNNKWGFINEKNEILVPFIYDSTRGFSWDNKLAQVSSKGKYGFIDKKGNIQIPLQFDFAHDFSGGLAGVIQDNKLGFINERGILVIPYKYEVIMAHDGNGKAIWWSWFTRGGAAIVKLNGKWGLINKKGQNLTPFIYDDIESVSTNGFFDVTKDGKTVYLDYKGLTYPNEEKRRKTYFK